MIVFKFGEDLLHDSLPEQNGLCSYPESVTILIYRSHLTVIQVNDLSMPAYKRSLLLLQVLRIYAGNLFLLFGHFDSVLCLTIFRRQS